MAEQSVFGTEGSSAIPNSSIQNISRLRSRWNEELRNISRWNPEQCCKRNCVAKIGIEGCRLLRQKFLQASQLRRKSMLLEMRVSLLSTTRISEGNNHEESLKHGIASDGVVLCTNFLARVLNVHRQLVSSVIKRPSASSCDLPGRLLDSTTSGNFDISVVAFLHTLADEVSDEMPHNQERHLPHRNKRIVYLLYCESMKNRQENFCSRSHFYSVWKHLIPHIKCRKTHAFSICDTCILFRDRLMALARRPSRDRERQQTLNGFRAHLRQIKLERAEYARNRMKAMDNPSKVLSVIVDGADQSKFGIPRFLEKSKSEKGYSIKQKLIGVLFHGGLGGTDFLAYLTSPENIPGGSNQTIDAFCRCFLVLLEHRAFKEKLRTPDTLYIQLDNTSKDNKNRYFMAFCDWLVSNGVFKTVEVNFLPVGHTHEDIDRKFSRVSVALSCQDTITIGDLHRSLKQSV